MTKPSPQKILNIPIPVSEIVTHLKSRDSTAGKFFKEAVLNEVVKTIETTARKEAL